MGRQLRERLLPVIATFKGLLLVTLTVDPSLFGSPREAYEYMRERRCIARTMQDLWRRGVLHSRRYFYVVEWQRNTEQAHFHILLDASFVPWSFLLASWSKHRPSTAGPVVGGRPAFGTALISVPKFGGGAEHAAAYVTKYLTKTPEHGFPAWVLDLGAEIRVRRYSTSRGFWGEESEPASGEAEREIKPVTYRQRVNACGDSVDVFEWRTRADHDTGEITLARAWVGELAADAGEVLAGLPDDGRGRRNRRTVHGAKLADVVAKIEAAAGRSVEWRRGGHPPRRCDDVTGYSADELSELRHAEYVRNYDRMIRDFIEGDNAQRTV